MTKCIIFDCDGTLVDSEYLCNLGLQIKLKEYGVNLSAVELMEKFRGGKLASVIHAIEGEQNISLNEDFVPSYRSIVEALFEKELKPCVGVDVALRNIDIPKCVASSGPLEKINKALKLTGLSSHFKGNIFSSYEIGCWKPDPGLFLHAAKVMGFKPSDCVVVEDSQVGIEAAKLAGMNPILYDPNGVYAPTICINTIRHMRELQSKIT